jgi:hypothetical protein
MDQKPYAARPNIRFCRFNRTRGRPAATKNTTTGATIMAAAVWGYRYSAAASAAASRVVDLTADDDENARTVDEVVYEYTVEQLLQVCETPGCAGLWPQFEVCEAMQGRPAPLEAYVHLLQRQMSGVHERSTERAPVHSSEHAREKCGICLEVPLDMDREPLECFHTYCTRCFAQYEQNQVLVHNNWSTVELQLS